jgi:hypothetical protein
MAKYDPLEGHLRRQKTNTYEMTFADVERVISGLLPKSAQRPQWWANETNADAPHVQCKAWLDAGFNAFLAKGAEKVRFERR